MSSLELQTCRPEMKASCLRGNNFTAGAWEFHTPRSAVGSTWHWHGQWSHPRGKRRGRRSEDRSSAEAPRL